MKKAEKCFLKEFLVGNEEAPALLDTTRISVTEQCARNSDMQPLANIRLTRVLVIVEKRSEL